MLSGLAGTKVALPFGSAKSHMVEVCSLPLRLSDGSRPYHLNSGNQLARAATM